MIEIRGLRKRFGSNAVLDGVDLQIAAGRITAIVGPNAAGKSTLRPRTSSKELTQQS